MIGAALAVPYFYNRMDDEIRARMQARLSEQYPGLHIKIRSAVVVKGEGIAIRGLSILDPAAEGPGAELLSYDECFLCCLTDLQTLLTGDPQITRVTIRRPTLRMTRRADGSWSASKLLPLPKYGNGPAPEVTIENGTIEISDPLRTLSCALTLRDVNLKMTPVASAADPSGAPPQRRHVTGTLSGDYFRQVIFDGEVDPRHPDLAIKGSIQGLVIEPELRNALSGAIGGDMSVPDTLRGQAELNFDVRYDPAAQVPWQYDVTGRLVRGRVDDPRLPHPLTEIHAQVHINNEGFSINDCTARSNQAQLQVACRGGGVGSSSPLNLEAEVRQLELDDQLLQALPLSLQSHWLKYQPQGQVDATVRLSYDGQTWKPEIQVRCQNVSFKHHKFPYRLEHGKGIVSLKDDVLRLSVTADSENQLVHVDGEFRNPFTAAVGWVRAQGKDVPVDQKFLAALPDDSQAVARSLDLRGTLSFTYELWRKEPTEPFHQHLLIEATRCWIRYVHFPWAISDIRGTLEMTDGQWVFRNLEGTNGTSRIRGDGTLAPTPAGNELLLHFCATGVPLEEELRDALQPAMRQVWSVLKPRGIIDLVADMRYVDRSRHLDVSVRAEPRSEVCSIEPTDFPYRLEKLQGVMTYSGGRLTFDRLRAEHGPVGMTSTGYCEFQPDGGWQLHLGRLTVDRLRIDRELMQALPARLKKNLGELSPAGPISLQGRFDLGRGGNPSEPVRSQWDLMLGLNQVALDCGLRVENVYGSMTLIGGFDGQSLHSHGELTLESLTCKDYQVTDMRGPYWIEDQYVFLGIGACQRENQFQPRGSAATQPLRHITAKMFGGRIGGDARVDLGSSPLWVVQAGVVDVDLATCAREMQSSHQNLRGKIQGEFTIQGQGHSRNSLAGGGTLHLHDANVYELPVLISVLKILSRSPDPNTFSRSDADFRIRGEHVYFDKLNFNADAVSLLGKGEVNFQGETRMSFTPVVGGGDAGIPLLRKFFTGAGQQLMVIHVGGTIQNPDIRKEAMPGVNQALQQLQDRGGEARR